MGRAGLVVGFDESAGARSALAWAAAEAARAGLPLLAVHVLSWPYGPCSSDLDEMVRDAEPYDVYPGSVISAFRACRLHPACALTFARGAAGPALVERSRDAAALVVGMPGQTGLGRLPVGSVAHHCLSHATCPVVVVPAATLAVVAPATTPDELHEVMA
jgi:nucleotide-binding universal stress UspA family protein